MHMARIVNILIAILLMAGSADALGITSASFAEVEQGNSYVQAVTLMNSPNDFDNHFVIEIRGEIKDWIKVSPSEFDLAKGENKQINLTLEVPKDARLGEVTGSIIASGKKTTSTSGEGANVGYAVATKGNIYSNVVKPGAVASVEITGAEATSPVPAGSVAKLTVTAKNSGNVATSASFKLDIKKEGRTVANITGTTADFALGEEKTVKLFWDTQSAEEGSYDAYVEALTIARGSEKTKTTVYKPITVIIGEVKGESSSTEGSSTLIAAVGLVILIAVILVVLKRRK